MLLGTSIQPTYMLMLYISDHVSIMDNILHIAYVKHSCQFSVHMYVRQRADYFFLAPEAL